MHNISQLLGILSWLGFTAMTLIRPAFAEVDSLQWSGYFSTGVAVTDSDVPYEGDIGKRPTYVRNTHMGLNLSKILTPQVRVGAQLIARAGLADSLVKVDWVFLNYDHDEHTTFILGKQRVPLWMHSEYYDVGRAYPWVQPPEEVYSLFAARSFTGASASYLIKIGSSQLRTRAFYGDILHEGNPNAPSLSSKVRAEDFRGAGLEWEREKLQLRATYGVMTLDFDLDPAAPPFGIRKAEIYALSLRDEIAGFSLMGEYVETEDLKEKKYLRESRELAAQAATAATPEEARLYALRAFRKSIRVGGAHGYYATIARQTGSWMPHLTAARISRPFFPNSDQVQKSLNLGLNYDLNMDSVLKIEAKRIDVPGHSQGLFGSTVEAGKKMIYRLGYALTF